MSTPPPVPPDDSNVPPVPPLPPVAPPSFPSVQPGTPQPQTYYPPVVSPKSTMGGGTKALLFGCLGIVVLVLIAVGIGGKMIWGKVKAIADNPEQFVGETIAKAHPELEFVSADKGSRTITFRDKATGESMTARFEDFKDGRIKLTKSDGSEVELGPEGMKAKDKDGNQTVVGSGEAVPPPAWVPAYPGQHTVVLSSRQNQGGTLKGVYVFSTEDDVPTAKAAYQKALTDAGFAKLETSDSAGAGVQAATITASADGGNGLTNTITLQISGAESKTQVTLNYDQSPAEK